MFTVDSDNKEGFTVECSADFETGHAPFYVDASDPGYLFFLSGCLLMRPMWAGIP